MSQSSLSGKFTREEFSTVVKDYFARNPEMYQQLLSMDDKELKNRSDGTPFYQVFTDMRDESRHRKVETGRDFSSFRTDIRVVSKDGAELFVLDDGQGGQKVTTMTAKEVYDKGIQWFEPQADKYMPMKSVGQNLASHPGLKHFTWKDIADFATKDRWMTDYRSGGSGDWKKSPEGGSGYFLVTVGGKPYWADAIGQIPYAVNNATNEMKEHGDSTRAIKETVTTGQKHGQGQLFGGAPDTSNTYDNYFVLRGATWAAQRYGRNDVSPERLGDSISRESAVRYGVISGRTRD
jgi:hypothetical protein